MDREGWPPVSDPITPADKDALLQHMDESWLRLNGFIETLTPAQLTEPTDAAGWSVRDHLDHLRAWENGMVCVFQQQSRAQGMGIAEDVYASADINAINEAIRQSTIDVSLPEVRQNLAATHQRLRAVVAATPAEDLHKPYRWFLPDNVNDDDERSMLHKVAGNSSQHIDEHLPWMQGIADLAAP
jgi:uncharacterized protein (TIGR03083 family)